jgi:hypothetical protein
MFYALIFFKPRAIRLPPLLLLLLKPKLVLTPSKERRRIV